jgi:hypothetical protein
MGDFPFVQAYNIAMEHPELIVAQTYGDRMKAELAKAALEDAGIQAIVQGDTAGGMREHLAWSGAGFKILVREEDASDARELLSSPVGNSESADADFPSDDDPRQMWRRFT